MTKKIVYIGDDHSYWSTIQSRYRSYYPEGDFEFITINEKNPEKYHLVFQKLLIYEPVIIYIDFSVNFKNYMKLMNLLHWEFSYKDIPLVGLVDKKEQLYDCRLSGLHFVHVKCGEYFDVFYAPFSYACPTVAQAPDFARAKFEKEAELVEDFRVAYITPTTMHVEGNMRLKEGEHIKVMNSISDKYIPSTNYFVSQVYDTDLYYPFKRAFDLGFVYVDQPDWEGEELAACSDDERRAVKREYEEQLAMSKRKTKEWILSFVDMAKPKKTKILMIDKDVTFLTHMKKDLDSYPFAIRCKTELSHELLEIDKIRPQIIAFQFTDDSLLGSKKEQEEEPKAPAKPGTAPKKGKVEQKKETVKVSCLDQLNAIMTKIKSLDKYNPFVILFNCGRRSSQVFQENYSYPLLLANADHLSLDVVLHMATMLEKKHDAKLEQAITVKINQLKQKDPAKYRKLTKNDFVEPKYYINKKNELGLASISHPIVIKTMTESEITFLTDEDLDIGEIFRINFPTSMSLTIVPQGDKKCEKESNRLLYRGLIHSVDEIDKKKIRKFVNEIFFSTINEKRAKEAEEFDKKNKDAAATRKKMTELEGAGEGEGKGGASGA